MQQPAIVVTEVVTIPMGGIALRGALAVPASACGLVVFVGGDDRDELVAAAYRQCAIATLCLELSTEVGAERERLDATLRSDAASLAERLIGALDAMVGHGLHRELPIGLLGRGERGAVALIAAARRPHLLAGVAGLGARLELAGPALVAVRVPTLLIVGSADTSGMRRHREAARAMVRTPTLAFISGANELLEQPGALPEAAAISAAWFVDRFRAVEPPSVERMATA